MATEKEIKITADTASADKDVKELLNTVKDLNETTKESSKNMQKGIDDLGDSAKATEKEVKGIKKGFTGVGLAIKALGIGLLLKAFDFLADLLMQNQGILDFFTTTFNVLSIAFRDFSDFVINNFSKVTEFIQKAFSAEGIKEFGRILKENIIERFKSLLDTLGFIGKAFAKLFKGDFKGALDEVKNAGKEFIDVITGVDGSYEKAKKLIQGVTSAIAEYGKATLKTSKAMTELKNQAILAAIIQRGLIEDLNLQAERLRQFRDSDLNSINARIEANQKLKKVLEDQEKDMLLLADLQIAAAKMEIAKVDNLANQGVLQEALNERKAIEAAIAGFMSEQLSQETSLLKEQFALKQSIVDSDVERSINQMKFNASQIEAEDERFAKLLEINEKEKELRTQQLQDRIDTYALDTQARVDAEIELNDFLQENANERTQIESDALDQQIKDGREARKERRKDEELVAEGKVELAKTVINLVGQFTKKGGKIAKGVAVSQALMNTYQGITAELATKTFTPWEFALKLANVATVATIGFANVKNILATDESGSSGIGGGGGSTPSAPSFNLVQGTGTNQIAEGLQAQDQPIKTYVVSSEVSTGQEADRKIVKGASL